MKGNLERKEIKLERIDLLWDAFEDCLCKTELRAEFDRLKSENEKIEESRQAFIKILDETMLENESLQSWLDKICEPIKKGRYEGGSGWTESNATWKLVCDYLNSQKKPRPADSHKKPNHVHSDDGGIFWEGQEGDCPICSPKSKPLTQCPECIWGQKRREFTAVAGAYCKYVIYECCSRCKGEGRISC